ncbi:dihydrodipicolinate synthase family protein [Bacillus salipaludis]|uniref:dihydrodipicolinate synthase family protein n=1 Tax=Bacillus salipaludis TaxID=2547811 RepID=UPI003557C65A
MDLPIMLYNIPERSEVDVATDTILRFRNISTIKEASSDLSKIAYLLEKALPDIKYILC